MVLRLIEDGRPLDEIVFFDTGWEFPQMYDHIAKVEAFTGRAVTRVHPVRPFDWMMMRHPIIARKGPLKGQVHRHGHGWPSMQRRWCTRLKCNRIDKHCGDAVRYVGIAADEAHRMTSANLMSSKFERKYPLVEWDMGEAACLAYCRARGFDWGGLYDIFPRVSCYCCPLQRIGQLRNLRRNFPALWAQMLAWDAEIGAHNRGFKGYDKVADLERRFAQEDRQGPPIRPEVKTVAVSDRGVRGHGAPRLLRRLRPDPESRDPQMMSAHSKTDRPAATRVSPVIGDMGGEGLRAAALSGACSSPFLPNAGGNQPQPPI